LLGRGSTVINTGGEKVHPEEVEDVLKSLAGVVDVVVWRVPDERLGSVVGAVVQRLPGSAIDEHDVCDHVRVRLAGYKAPRVVAFVDTIPRHVNGKIDAARIDAVLSAVSD
jgi:fatty-acyl-CoA synthase